MNGEQMYEEFKLILDCMGVGFNGKDKVEVTGTIVFIHGAKKIELFLGEIEK